MKNENVKVTETATETVNETVNTTANVETNEVEEVVLPVYVERTVVHTNGKKYNNYFVKGTLNGREIKADLIAVDLGGYEILDIAFGDKKTKLLGIERSARKDATDKVVRYNSYYVAGEDELGIIFKVGLRPRETSDKTYLEYIIAKAQKLKEQSENKE